MKRTWIVVGLVVAALVGVLAWQVWPEDEPTDRERLLEVDGVTSASGSKVWFPDDTELSRLRSSVDELTNLAERDETKIDVVVGEVLFHIDSSNFYGPADPQRAAELAWVAAGVDDVEEGRVSQGSRERLEVRIPRRAALTTAADQALDRLAAEDIEPPEDDLDVNLSAGPRDASGIHIRRVLLDEARYGLTRIAAAVEASPGELLEAELSDVGTQVSIEAPRLADVAGVRRSVLDEVGRDRVHLRVFSGGTEIPRVLQHRPDAAVELISRLRRTGASAESVDAGLESVSIEAPTASVAERVRAVMGSPSWPAEPKATVRLALPVEGAESSALIGDTASVLTVAPMFIDLHRAGYRTALRGTSTDRPRFVVETAYGDGEAVVDLSDPKAVRRLVSVLRAGDWRGAARFEIFGSRTVLLTFTSTATGRARDVEKARSTRSDRSDVELADELNRLVGRWNASAGS